MPSTQYGAVAKGEPMSEFDYNLGHHWVDKHQAMAKARRVVNWVPLLLALLLPWFLFLFVFRSVSNKLHYQDPLLSFLCALAAVLVSLYSTHKAYHYSKLNPNTGGGIAGDKAFYWKYFAAAFWMATFWGWLLGDLNFWFHLMPFYDIDHLATYVNLDPSSMTGEGGLVKPALGKRYLDAGKVYFKDDAQIDKDKAMSFRNGDLYCVAPIVSKSCPKNCGYDFWAIGLNCCSENAADFRCGEYGNKRAKNGLRLMRDDQRPFFRLAVMEAETQHSVVSNHPLFFYWLEDPDAEIDSYRKKGYANYIICMFLFFFGNATALGLTLKAKLWS